ERGSYGRVDTRGGRNRINDGHRRDTRAVGPRREGAGGVDPRMVEDGRAMAGLQGGEARRPTERRHGATVGRGRRPEAPAGGGRRAARLRRAAAREAARGRAARAAEELMDPRALAVLIPIVALGGFFGSVIAFILSRTYLAKLKAQGHASGGAVHDEVLAAVDELRREVAELAERVDFTE